MSQVVKRIFSHSQANLKNSLSLARKALYWRNRAELTTTSIDGYNKESMSDMSEVRESSCAIKSNFFAEIKELETEISISTPSPTK
jgi:hypothetical protein